MVGIVHAAVGDGRAVALHDRHRIAAEYGHVVAWAIEAQLDIIINELH